MTSLAVERIKNSLAAELDRCSMHISKKQQIALAAYQTLEDSLDLDSELCICGLLNDGEDVIFILYKLAVQSTEKRFDKLLNLTEIQNIRETVDSSYEYALRKVRKEGDKYKKSVWGQ